MKSILEINMHVQCRLADLTGPLIHHTMAGHTLPFYECIGRNRFLHVLSKTVVEVDPPDRAISDAELRAVHFEATLEGGLVGVPGELSILKGITSDEPIELDTLCDCIAHYQLVGAGQNLAAGRPIFDAYTLGALEELEAFWRFLGHAPPITLQIFLCHLRLRKRAWEKLKVEYKA